MRVLLYEWCCSGGLHGPDRDVFLADDAGDDDVAAIAREGRAMVLAVLVDAARSQALSVEVLVDATRPLDLPDGAQPRSVPPGEEIARLRQAAAACDVALVIAPETAGILGRRVAAARDAGATVIAPDAGFIATTTDKQATVLALAAAGVPVPAGRALSPGAPWPNDFVRPAVRKRLDGVGCDGLMRVGPHDPAPAASDHATRVEVAVAGTPVGVACVCGAGGIVPLPPFEQHFTTAPEPAYAGGTPVVDVALRRRAETLACRAIGAVERATSAQPRGWVGVDLVIGLRTDGRDDRVLEINPRLTTSFVSHAGGRDHSLTERMIDAALGTARGDFVPHHAPMSFTVGGHDVPVCHT
jgi:predicted ATP-grasp superfamily ATP-dependent carboligase